MPLTNDWGHTLAVSVVRYQPGGSHPRYLCLNYKIHLRDSMANGYVIVNFSRARGFIYSWFISIVQWVETNPQTQSSFIWINLSEAFAWYFALHIIRSFHQSVLFHNWMICASKCSQMYMKIQVHVNSSNYILVSWSIGGSGEAKGHLSLPR